MQKVGELESLKQSSQTQAAARAPSDARECERQSKWQRHDFGLAKPFSGRQTPDPAAPAAFRQGVPKEFVPCSTLQLCLRVCRERLAFVLSLVQYCIPFVSLGDSRTPSLCTIKQFLTAELCS